PVARNSAATTVMKKRVIVVSGLSLAVFARRILCWQDEAISHTVAVTWLLCNRRCSVERSATVYSSARLQLLVLRFGYGREHTAISIFAYPSLRALPMLPSGAQRYWIGAREFSFVCATLTLSIPMFCLEDIANWAKDHYGGLWLGALPTLYTVWD